MTRPPKIPAILRGGPYEGELRMLDGPGTLRIPVPPKVAVYRPVDELRLPEIEVGEYRPIDDNWRDADGRVYYVYRYHGPHRYFMCTRAGCMKRRQKVAWDRRCRNCHERTYPHVG